MMRLKRTLSSLLALCLVLTMLPGKAAAMSGGTAEGEGALSVTATADAVSEEAVVSLFDGETENTNGLPSALSPVDIGSGAETAHIFSASPALSDGGESAVYDGTRVPSDTEVEIDDALSVVEADISDGVAADSLFDGAPDYALESSASLVPEDGSGLDGAADETWETLLKSFDSQSEISGISGSAGAGSGLDGGTLTPEQVGELDGSGEQWEAPGLTDENGGTTLPLGTLPDGSYDPDTSGGDLDGGSAPNGYYFEISSTRCVAGSYITFYTTFSNTTSAYLIVKDRNSGRSVSYGISAYVRYRLNFPGEGSYALYLCLYNRYGMFDGSRHNGTLYVKSGQAPRPYWMSISTTSAAVNQQVTLHIDRKNATKATLVVTNLDNNNIVYRDTVGSVFECRFTGAGHYTFHLVTENEFGTYDGSQHNGMTIRCNVSGAPTAYSWRIDGKSYISENESTKVQVTDLGGATKATAILERSGTVVGRCTFTGPTGITVTPGSPGVYKLYLITQNNYGTYNGKTNNKVLTITVSGSASDYWMSINKTQCYTGEQLTFSIDPRQSSYFYFVIEKDGQVIYRKNHGLARGIAYTPSQAGTYRFYLITYNNYGSFNGGTHNGYSLTCVVKAKQRTFSVTSDSYRFINTYDDLGYGRNDKISLASYQAVFGNAMGYTRWLFADVWGGSCFGFASTAAWAFQHPDGNFPERFGNFSTMYAVTAPRNRNSNVTTTLERYQLSQGLNAVNRENSANENKVTALANAVEAAENGGKMVILGVFRSIPGSSSLGGHAVVPYEHYMSGSNHIFRVYDCNTPGRVQTVTMTADSNGNMRTFRYDNGNRVYDHSFDFVYADTVRSALPSAARDGAAEDDTLMVILGGDPGTVTCAGLSGAVDLSQYEISLLDSDLNGTLYYFPSGSYTLTCTADSFQEFSCSAANSATSASATASGTRVIFSVGNMNGDVQCSARSDREGEMHMSLVNSAGQLSCLDGAGTYLGATLDGAGGMQATSDQNQIEHNGEKLDLSWGGGSSGDLDGAGGTASADVEAFLDGGAQSWSVESTSSVRLTLTEGGITGTFTLLTENPGEMAERELVVEAFDEDGKSIGTERIQTAIGTGRSAVRIALTGAIKWPEKVSSGALTFKVAIVGEAAADAAVFDNVALADGASDSGPDGAIQKLAIAGTGSVHLALANGGITGTLNLTVKNPEQAAERDVFVAAYDTSGRMVGVEKTRLLTLAGTSTAVVTLGGGIHPDKKATGPLTFKAFLPADGMAPLCSEAVFNNVKVDGIE